ncbi:MAG TPA: hypothetical protein DEB24_07610 [Coriobacteriia bacterium]|nr:hypothetical protein [Coriobacteriia bacterium]
MSRGEDGIYRVMPDPNQSSALLGALTRSNCLLVVPEGDGSVAASDTVSCVRLDVLEGTL